MKSKCFLSLFISFFFYFLFPSFLFCKLGKPGLGSFVYAGKAPCTRTCAQFARLSAALVLEKEGRKTESRNWSPKEGRCSALGPGKGLHRGPERGSMGAREGQRGPKEAWKRAPNGVPGMGPKKSLGGPGKRKRERKAKSNNGSHKEGHKGSRNKPQTGPLNRTKGGL
jgi:hypothetical protein